MILKNMHHGSRGLLLAVIIVSAMFGDRSMARTYSNGYLGVSIEKLSHDEKKDLGISFGVRVTGVDEESPADQAGIVEDDIIQYYDGKKIWRPDDLTRHVRRTRPKTEVKVVLLRDSKTTETTVKIGRLKNSFDFDFRLGGRDGLHFRGEEGSYLGVRLVKLNGDLASYFNVNEDEGALILEVERDSPAEKEGLKPGDVIVEMDSELITCPEDVQDILSDLEKGDEIEIKVVRHNLKQGFKIKVEEDSHPANRIIRIFKNSNKKGCREMDLHLNLPQIDELDFPQFDGRWMKDFNKDLDKQLKDLNRKIRKDMESIKTSVLI